MDRQTVVDGYVAKLERIGSTEIARHLGVALDRSALKARDRFRESMRQVLGRGRSGARAMLGGNALSAYTVGAVNYTPIAFRSGMDEGDLRTEVYVNAQQGKTGRDQSAFLKFQFGEGAQARTPGDVGLSDDQIDVLQAETIVLTQKLDDMTANGRQRRGVLAWLAAGARHRSVRSRSEVMSDMAATAASRRAFNASNQTPLSLSERLDSSRRRYGDVALRNRISRGSGSAIAIAHALKAHNEVANDAGSYAWGVFKAPDRDSGMPAFFARPPRILDPAGGYRTFTRRDGTVAKMPRMLAVAPEYGVAGKASGPRALTRARSKVAYYPKLQGPWESMADTATEDLAEALAIEYAHAVERMEQGRSY